MTSNIDRLQTLARCFSVVAAFEILMDFISPALWILTTPQSVISRVAGMSFSAAGMGAIWLCAGALVIPFVLMQVFDPNYEHRRGVIKLCNFGNILGGLIWFFMAFLARNLDYEYLIYNFIFNGLGSLVMAAILANSLNNDQIESALARRKGWA